MSIRTERYRVASLTREIPGKLKIKHATSFDQATYIAAGFAHRYKNADIVIIDTLAFDAGAIEWSYSLDAGLLPTFELTSDGEVRKL